MKILLVEDHKDFAITVCEYLEHHDMYIDYAHNFTLAKQLLSEHRYHVIILDINLPDGDGYSLCKFLRNDLGLDTPTIMLTARDDLEDRLMGFDSGTDDYLIKPFDFPELVARINALHARFQGHLGHVVLVVDELMLDLNKGIVQRQNQHLNVSPIGFKILSLLMKESPKIITRQELEMHIWGEELPNSDSLRSHLYLLRKVVDKPFDKRLIKTMTGLGVKIESA